MSKDVARYYSRVPEKIMKEIINSTYTEIHNHLRATDDKRDKLVNLYFFLVIAVLSAALALVSKSDGTLTVSISVVIATFLFLEALGYLVTFSEISSRKWHAEYMNCSVLIQELSRFLELDSDSDSTKSKASEELTQASEPPVKFPFDQFSTRSLLTTQLAMLFSKTVMIIVIITTCEYRKHIVALLIALLLLLLLQAWNSLYRPTIVLRKAQIKFWKNPWDSWILIGLKEKGEDTLQSSRK